MRCMSFTSLTFTARASSQPPRVVPKRQAPRLLLLDQGTLENRIRANAIPPRAPRCWRRMCTRARSPTTAVTGAGPRTSAAVLLAGQTTSWQVGCKRYVVGLWLGVPDRGRDYMSAGGNG